MKTTFSKAVLPNRMQVYVVPMAGTDATTVVLYCKVGSRQETKRINGSSHFLEHLMFKGTKRRPSTLVLSRELESMGAEFNAFTGKNQTAYYIKAQSEHLSRSLDILEDMLFHSQFQEKEIQRERGVIIEEIKMYEENPMMHIEDLLEQTIFSGPLGWSIAGPAKTIARVTRKELLEYKNAFYQPANMVCVIAGKIPKNVRALAVRHLGKPKNQHSDFPRWKPAVVSAGKISVQQKKAKQAQLAIAYEGLDYNHPDIAPLEVFSTIFGASMSSRLFIQVRERKGLCYFVKSDVSSYEDTGSFSILAGVATDRLEEAVRAINAEIGKVRRDGITTEELNRAKEYVKGKFILKMEASDNMAQWFGQEALFMKKVKRPEDRLKEIEAVTRADVNRVSRAILDSTKRSVAAIGPFTDARIAALFPKT